MLTSGKGAGKVAKDILKNRIVAKDMKRIYDSCAGLEAFMHSSVYITGANGMVLPLINKLQKCETPRLTKGKQMWEYLYSADEARAFGLPGENGADGETYVIGRGKTRPLEEYMKTIRDIVCPNDRLKFGTIPYSEKQVMHLRADISD